MALFGLFKSKEEKEMESAFASMHKRIFPGGDADIQRDNARIGQLTRGKLGAEDLGPFTMGCKVLVHISDDYGDDDFVRSFVARSKNRLTEAEAYEVYVYLAGEAFYRDVVTKMWMDQGKAITSEMRAEIDNYCEKYKRGTYKDAIEGGHGDFGVTLTNPIPTISVKCSNNYLARIRYQGRPVEHKRVGSTSSPVTMGNVDIYELSVNGRDVGTIYICPYHRRNSRTAPKGFALE